MVFGWRATIVSVRRLWQWRRALKPYLAASFALGPFGAEVAFHPFSWLRPRVRRLGRRAWEARGGPVSIEVFDYRF